MVLKINFENEIPELKWATIECNKCGKDFDAIKHGKDIYGDVLHDYIDLKYGKFDCPNCDNKIDAINEDITMNGEEGLRNQLVVKYNQ